MTKLAKRGFYRDWYAQVLADQESGARPARIKKKPKELAAASRRFKSIFERKSPDTIKTYRTAAKNFGKYLGIRLASPSRIIERLIILTRIEAETLVDDYVHWLDHEEEAAPNTINAYLSAIKFFVRAARKAGYIEWELDVEGVKGGRIKDVRGPTIDEARRIIEVVDELEHKAAARDRLICYMLVFMGLRISSILTLDVRHIDFKKKGAKFRLKGRGKVRKFKRMPPKTWEVLELWLEERGDGDGPLITNFTNGGRLTRQSVDKMLAKIGRKAGLETKLHAHAFRHFVASEGKEIADKDHVRKLTEHKSEKVFNEYDDEHHDHATEVAQRLERHVSGEPLDDDDDDDDGVMSAADAEDGAVEYNRMSSGFRPFDEVIGGGLVAEGQIVGIAGAPGLGKSTMCQQAASGLAERNGRVLYVTGEQSTKDLLPALKRIGATHRRLLIYSTNDITKAFAKARSKRAQALFIDSINCMQHPGSKAMAGNPSQIKKCIAYVVDEAKKDGEEMPTILICHATKDDKFSGPRMLEHMVDTTLMFEGEENSRKRYIKPKKNRMGSTLKKIPMSMTDHGLEDGSLRIRQEKAERKKKKKKKREDA